jgi:hypothetical protein
MKSAVLSNSSYLTLKTNSKILYPSALLGIVAPTALVDYQFRSQGTLTNYGSVGGSLALTRSGNGTFIGSNGLLQTASTNVARFDFDPVSLARRGLLFEGQASQILLQSESLNVSPWVASTTTVTANNATDPSGGTGAESIVNTGTTNGSWVRQLITTAQASGTYYFSLFAASSNATLHVDAAPSVGDTSSRALATVNLNTGAVTYISNPIGGASVFCLLGATGFWRIVNSFSSTNFQRCEFRIGASTSTSGPVIAWGANVTKDSLSSYIPTTTAAATRFADAASMTGLPTTNVTLIEKPAGCATLSAGTLTLNPGYTIDRIMVLPGTYSADQVATIRGLM